MTPRLDWLRDTVESLQARADDAVTVWRIVLGDAPAPPGAHVIRIALVKSDRGANEDSSAPAPDRPADTTTAPGERIRPPIAERYPPAPAPAEAPRAGRQRIPAVGSGIFDQRGPF